MSQDDVVLEEFQQDFLNEAAQLLAQCEECFLHLEDQDRRPAELAKIFRLAHSVKGGAAAVGLPDLAEFAHALEDCLSVLRMKPHLTSANVISLLLRGGDALKERVEQCLSGNKPEWNVTALREELKFTALALEAVEPSAEVGIASDSREAQVPVEEFGSANSTESDFQLNPGDSQPNTRESQAVAAQVIEPKKEVDVRAKSEVKVDEKTQILIDLKKVDEILDLVGELVVLKSQLMFHPSVSLNQDVSLKQITELLERNIRSLQDRALGMRMTSIKPLFVKLQRVSRDLSLKLGKPLDYEMTGENTELDRNMIELLGDPLMHIVRNAIDHGIEAQDKRLAAQKPSKARLRIQAQQKGGRVYFIISDDGGGIPREKVLKKAIERGLIDSNIRPEEIPDRDVFNLIFMPGFSTAEKVSDVSGRGVGLDVVRTNIEKMRGSVEVDSVFGKGTVFTISVPLTTAISDGMVALCQGRRFIFPTHCIREVVPIQRKQVYNLDNGERFVTVREQSLPFLEFDQIIGSSSANSWTSPVSTAIVLQQGTRYIAVRVDGIEGQSQFVVKPLGEGLTPPPGFSGGAVMGDGRIALVIDPESIIRTQPLQHFWNIKAA